MGWWWDGFLRRREAARRRRLRERARHSRAMVAAFTAGREPQADADFLAACPGGGERGRWLLAARWAVARVSRMRPELVRASDRFADLTALPGWSGDCVGFDLVVLVAHIEAAAGLSLPDRELERVPSPDLHGSLRVGEFAAAVAAACERVSPGGGQSAEPTAAADPQRPNGSGGS